MPPHETPQKAGYNEAANDLATVLVELHRLHPDSQRECVDITQLVTRFQELRNARFPQPLRPVEIPTNDLKNFLKS